MTDRFRSRLSEYMDGELAQDEHALVERHLAECEECARTLVDLEAVAERARGVAPRRPATDLWPGIAARLASPNPTKIVEAPSARPAWSRRIALSIPQLAAAAVAVASLSGGLAWLAGSGGPEIPGGPVAMTVGIQATNGSGDVQAVADAEEPLGTVEYYAASIDELERILFDSTHELPPQTEARIRRALVTIDRAIEDARQALKQVPDDPYLSGHVRSTLRQKSEFLRSTLRLAAQS